MDNLKKLAFVFSLLALAGACEVNTSTHSPAPPAVSGLSSAEAPLAPGVPDIAGCWRPTQADGVFSTGPAFYFFRIEPNAFILGKDAKTKFLVNQQGLLSEINRDPEKPFFPPNFVVSSGSVNPENTAIERRFPGDSRPRIYRRCQFVQSVPPHAPVIFDGEPQGTESATPTPTLAPLILKSSTPVTAKPPASAPPAIDPAPIPQPIPQPTPSPRATPAPTATPQPLLTPLVVPSRTPFPTDTATPDPGSDASPTPNSTP